MRWMLSNAALLGAGGLLAARVNGSSAMMSISFEGVRVSLTPDNPSPRGVCGPQTTEVIMDPRVRDFFSYPSFRLGQAWVIRTLFGGPISWCGVKKGARPP